MDKTLIPQSNAKEKIEKDGYSTLVSKLNNSRVPNSIDEKQSLKCIFQNMQSNYRNGISQQLKLSNNPNCIFSINVKLICKNSFCNNFNPSDGCILQVCKCGHQAYLNISLTNLGEAVRIKMDIAAEKQDLQLIKMFDWTENFEKNETFQKDWQIAAPIYYAGTYFRLYNNQTRCYHYSGDLFSSTGNLTLVCDMKYIKDDGMISSESRFPGTFAMLASKFSDANVNPPSPPQDLLTDVVLCVGKNKIYCHKLVLGMTSKFFERMFLSDMKESRSSEIELKGFDLHTIKSVISFMYKDKIENNEINVEVLAAADMYQVLRLKDICSSRLAKTINFTNVSKIWQCAYSHNVEDLAHAALIYMLEKWKRLAKQDDIRELCSKYPKLLFTISTLMAEDQKDDSE